MAEPPAAKRRRQQDATFDNQSRHLRAPVDHVDLYALFRTLCRHTKAEDRIFRLEELLTLFRFVYFWTQQQGGGGGGFPTQESVNQFLENSDEHDGDDEEVATYRRAQRLWDRLNSTNVIDSTREDLAEISNPLCGFIERRLEWLAAKKGLVLAQMPRDILQEIARQLPLASRLLMEHQLSRTLTLRSNISRERATGLFYQTFMDSVWPEKKGSVVWHQTIEWQLGRYPMFRTWLFYLACIFTTEGNKWRHGTYRGKVVSGHNSPLPAPPPAIKYYDWDAARRDLVAYQMERHKSPETAHYPEQLFAWLSDKSLLHLLNDDRIAEFDGLDSTKFTPKINFPDQATMELIEEMERNGRFWHLYAGAVVEVHMVGACGPPISDKSLDISRGNSLDPLDPLETGIAMHYTSWYKPATYVLRLLGPGHPAIPLLFLSLIRHDRIPQRLGVGIEAADDDDDDNDNEFFKYVEFPTDILATPLDPTQPIGLVIYTWEFQFSIPLDTTLTLLKIFCAISVFLKRMRRSSVDQIQVFVQNARFTVE